MSDIEFSDNEEDTLNKSQQVLFNKAADHVQHIHKQISQADLLQLYAYYKQATTGPCNTQKPSIFQQQARAKWSAWQNLANMSAAEAQEKYVQKLQQIDAKWYEQTLKEMQQQQNASKQHTGSWVVHSTLQQANDNIDESNKNIFDWVREGDLTTLIEHLTVQVHDTKQLLQELDEHGMGLLHWATDRNHSELLKHLIQLGADVNMRDSEQQTPLHYAASCGHQECVFILLSNGADCLAADTDGQTCIEVAENAEIRQLLHKSLNN